MTHTHTGGERAGGASCGDRSVTQMIMVMPRLVRGVFRILIRVFVLRLVFWVYLAFEIAGQTVYWSKLMADYRQSSQINH
jgi:hypothetical protein